MRYQLDQESFRAALVRFEGLDRTVADLPLAPMYEDWFRRRNWVRTFHGTTHIEGNTLNDEEVEEVLVEGPRSFSRRDSLEIINIRAATKFVDERAGDPDLDLDEALVRETHRRVLEGINDLLRPGEYRRGENRVTDGEGNLIFGTPVSGDVPALMREFGVWLRGGCDAHPAAIAAALAHLELVAIHPFYDGNGRTARLVARTLLRRHGYTFRDIVSLDAQLDVDRPRYFGAIRAAVDQHYVPGYDATPFVSYFVDALSASMQHALERIGLFNNVVALIREAAANGKIPPASVDPLAYTWINRAIRPARYQELTGRSRQLTTYDLGRLDRAGFLEPVGATRQRKHLIGPELEALTDRARARPVLEVRTERDIVG